MKILINVTNARNVGGGLQVAVNFIKNTTVFKRPNVEWFYAVSETMDSVYLKEDFRPQIDAAHYFVFPNQPDFKNTFRRVQKQLYQLETNNNIDVVFTILGPNYHLFKTKEVVRFVHPWVVTSNKYAWSNIPFKEIIRMKAHILLLKYLVKKKGYVITQTNAVKNGLNKEIGILSERIRVVPNVLPAIFNNLDNTHIDKNDSWIDVASVGAGYHKNLNIIPNVIKELDEKYGIKNMRFHVTLPEGALGLEGINKRVKELGISDRFVNHGNLRQQQLSELYRTCDLCFLPTVLEVFSASTLEAMYFGLPTVATDLPFNTEVFKDACLYYTPMNAVEAASKLVELSNNKILMETLKSRMKDRLSVFSSFETYFNSTVDFLEEVAAGKV